MNTHQQPIILNLNSRDATTKNRSDDVNFIFNSSVDCDAGNRMMLSIVDFNCPYTYYLITELNQTLTFTLNSVSYSMIVPIGNYNILTLKKMLLSLWSHSAIFDISINDSTLKYTFTFTRINTATPFSLVVVDTPILKILGLLPSQTPSYVDNSIVTVATLVSENVVNMHRTKQVHLKSTSLHLNNFNSKGISNGTIGSFSVSNVLHGDIISISSNFKIEYLLKTLLMKSMHLYLVDDDGVALDLNNHDWSATFQVTFIKEIRLPIDDEIDEE